MSLWLILILLTLALYRIHKILTKKKPLILTKDSVIIITGGCDGIGRLTAIELAQKYKSKLIILDIQAQKFEGLKKELESHGSEVQCIECDLSNVESMDKALNEIKGKHPQIDVLVNNAGIAFQKELKVASSYSRNLKTLQVNYLAGSHLFVELLDQLKGHVVTIASIASIIRGNKLSSYVASKAAIYAFFNSARTELLYSHPHISMSLVCPWAIDTGMFEGFKTRLQKIVPLLKPNYVAEVIHSAIINKPEVVFIPEYIGFLSKLVNLLPDYYVDRLYHWADTSEYTNNRQKENLAS